MYSPHLASQADAAAVLSKAVVRAADYLGLNYGRLARILGVSPATVSRLAADKYQLNSAAKEWEFAVLVVRLFRALDSIVGTQESARTWLNGDNLALAAKPIELLQTTEGLVRVVHYLDASRARV